MGYTFPKGISQKVKSITHIIVSGMKNEGTFCRI